MQRRGYEAVVSSGENTCSLMVHVWERVEGAFGFGMEMGMLGGGGVEGWGDVEEERIGGVFCGGLFVRFVLCGGLDVIRRERNNLV